MRILISSINYAPELTGIGKYTTEMAEWLAAKGHAVRVVTSHPYYPEWRVYDGYASWRYKNQSLHGVDVWRCPLWVPSNPSGFKRLIHLASFALSSLPILCRQVFWRPHLVFVVEPPLFNGPFALLCAKFSGAKAWLHIQDFEIDAAYSLGIIKFNWLFGWIMRAESWFMKRFDVISSISPNMVHRLLKKGLQESSTFFFPNWADLSSIFPMSEHGALRLELRVPQDAIVALYSGNMGEKQGLEIILDAASNLQATTNVQFVLCGDGAARLRLKRQFKELKNVKWIPLQPLERLNELLNMADIHLLPQRAEAEDLVMPSKLTGMLASGRPVIATACHGTQLEMIVSQCGLVVQPGCVEQLAGAIMKLATDPSMRADLGAKARNYAEMHIEKDRVLSQFEAEIYRIYKSS